MCDSWLTALSEEPGEIKLITLPTERARPYGIKEDSKGMIGIAYRGANKIARVNPDSWEIHEYETPEPDAPQGTYIRRLAIASDDIIWYNESRQRPDALIRFDPKTEEFQSWAIPSGIGIIRHMRATPEGNLVIHQSSTNTVGLVMISKDDT